MPSRTTEFKACVESARLRQANSSNIPEHKQRLLASNSKDARKSNKSEFAQQAGDIAKEIQMTMGKLEKLAQRECAFLTDTYIGKELARSLDVNIPDIYY